MYTYRILAQHHYSSQRIQRTIEAADAADALKIASRQLFDTEYYVLSVTLAQ